MSAPDPGDADDTLAVRRDDTVVVPRGDRAAPRPAGGPAPRAAGPRRRTADVPDRAIPPAATPVRPPAVVAERRRPSPPVSGGRVDAAAVDASQRSRDLGRLLRVGGVALAVLAAAVAGLVLLLPL